jgi:hypothetical protein
MTLAQCTILKSNRRERKSILETLAFCGILETKNNRGYLNSFVPPHIAELKPEKSHQSQWAYPAIWWTGLDGINIKAWNYWFENYRL